MLATSVLAWPALRHPLFVCQLIIQGASPHLPVPVEGVRKGQLTNSWGSPRSGGRRHKGIDVFAPKDTSVLSTTPGIVFRVGHVRLGGPSVVVLGPGLEWHYYTHLNKFGDIKPGELVAIGDILGYVGDKGNAKGTPFHLHYGIYSPVGIAQNPYPRLMGSPPAEGEPDRPADRQSRS